MGIASSKATATATPEVGPGLTQSERSDAKETSIDAWLAQLDKQDNSTRLNFFHLFSLTVYESVDMTTNCDHLKEHLLMTCVNDRRRVERALQKPFMDGETLVTWTIGHLPETLLQDPTLTSIPSILAAQLEFDPSWRANKTLTDAMSAACCARDSNTLFQVLNPYTTSQRFKSDIYALAAFGSSPRTFEFTIHDFVMHMLAEGRIDLRFIYESRLYSLGFVIETKGQWRFFYNVLEDRSAAKTYTRSIHVDLVKSAGGERSSIFTAVVSSTYWTKGERIGGDASFLKNANKFVGRDRSLRGRLRILDY